MASSKDYLDFVLDFLTEIDGISFKKMMGEYLIYSNGILFGGIYDNRFLIKKTPSVSNLSLKEEIPYPGAKTMYLIDSENKEEITEIILKLLKDLS